MDAMMSCVHHFFSLQICLLFYPACRNVATCGISESTYEQRNAVCGFVHTGSYYETLSETSVLLVTSPDMIIELYPIIVSLTAGVHGCAKHSLKVRDIAKQSYHKLVHDGNGL